MSNSLQTHPYDPVGLAVTMSSIDLVDIINSMRGEGRAELLHKNFMVKIEGHPGIDSAKFLAQYKDSTGRSLKCYQLPKRECELMVMSESLEVQTKVYDHMTDLEQRLQAPRSASSIAAPVQAVLSEQLGIGQLFGVPVHLAQVEACKNVKAVTGVDLSAWLALAPAQDNLGATDVFLEPTDIGERFGLKGFEINEGLKSLGLQVKVGKSYTPTERAGGNAQFHQWTKAGKSGVNLKWRVSFVKSQLGLKETSP